MDGSSKGTTYRIFKHNIMFEPYLKLLPESLSFPILKFRLSNHKLPVETGGWENKILADRKCLLCQSESIGNEFHYLFECSFFEPSRQKYLPAYYIIRPNTYKKKVREKSRECHNHKPQPFPDPKRKRKPTNLNKHKPNKRTKSTKVSSLFPKRGNLNAKRTEKHKNKMSHGKTYNKSPRRINHKATKSKTNTGTTALERSVEQTTGGLKHFYN